MSVIHCTISKRALFNKQFGIMQDVCSLIFLVVGKFADSAAAS